MRSVCRFSLSACVWWVGAVHHQMAERELQNSMNEIEYQLIQLLEYQLPNGKKLVQLDLYKKQ